MELKEGMYVRTKWGINKINEYVPQSGQLYFKNDVCVKSNVIKASYNIIDLIEVGDYVNGMQVSRICFDEDGGRILNFYGSILELINEDIKSIITKEMFESMSYKVSE